MRRNFLTRTIICLIPTLLAAFLVVRAYWKDPEHYSGFKLGIDLRGGTILVYEVDQELSKESRGPDVGGRAVVDNAMAEALKRRIDPADLLSVIIRPLGNRVEIVLPYGTRAGESKSGVSSSDVDRIKELIREVGSLEFRILANDVDDGKAIADARAYFERAAASPDSDEAKKLLEAAKKGSPPPFPNVGPDDPGGYVVENEPVQYFWVELSKQERADLGVSSTHPGPGRRGDNMFPIFEQARKDNSIVRYHGNAYWSRPSQSDKNNSAIEESRKKQFDYFVLTRVSEKDRVKVGGDVTITAFVDQGRNLEPVIGFIFNSRGAEKFYQMTYRNRPKEAEGAPKTFRQLGIILDGYLISNANINEPIREKGQISGSFERSYVERIVTLLRSGALPATLKPLPVSENTIGPTLGRDTIKSGAWSILMAYLVVLAFMIIYYRFAGLVATVALLANLLLTIGFMLAVNATFTLPGLAGLVLMLGMAVDANVLIYERVREERDRGMNLPTALRNGYDRAFGTIIDTHLTSIFTAIVLYAVGNDQLKGFGISLTVGLIISLFTSLYMTRLIFDYWQYRNWLTKLRMLRFFSRPNIDFMKLRYYMFATTAVLTIGGLALFLHRGKSGLNVDFNGGTTYSGQLKNPTDIGTLRKLLSEDRQKVRLVVADVTEVPGPGGKTGNTFAVTYAGAPPTIIALANTPDGATPEERAANVKARASVLPDWSVEQIFTTGTSGDLSPLFTVRTLEREPEIVQATINRLFWDDEKNDTMLVETTATWVKA